ncbi:MAG: nucleoside phosphorylase [Flavobacteriales bacterium]
MKKIESSELVLNPDGSIYHLKLHPEQVANTIIVVGDQNRVGMVSKHFDHIEHQVANREFVTHTGSIGGKRITALSTGIGTDNVDIVMNELDALFNIDLKAREVKSEHQSFRVIRIGTSGTIQEDIPVDSAVISTHGLGFDGLAHFYQFAFSDADKQLSEAFVNQLNLPPNIAKPYMVQASGLLFNQLKAISPYHGITATANGFYGPQGRKLRIPCAVENLNEQLHDFRFENHRITNFEMETSALYMLSQALGHEACTACAIIANRARKEYSKNYKPVVENLIANVLEVITV